MSVYSEWMKQQDIAFIQEIHAGKIPEQFKDDKGDTEITLLQLAELDEKYINPEGKDDRPNN